jgi:hypothetical protein
VTGALPSGVTFSTGPDGAALSGTPAPGSAGQYPITVTATNDRGHVDQAFTLTVEKVASTVTLDAPGTVALGDAVTIGVDVTGGDPPSGTVDFAVGGTSLGSATLDGAGHAAFTTSALTAGAQVVQASYGGDSTFSAASSTVTIVVSDGSSTGGTSSGGDELAGTGIDPGGSPDAALALLIAGCMLLLVVAWRRRRSRGR